MRLSLSSSEFDRLSRLVEILHAPFDFPDLDAWRHAVNHHVEVLLEAHKVVFMLPGSGHAPVYSQRLDPAGLGAYLDYYHRFDVAGGIALERGLPVSSLVEIHGREEFYASEYYNDFMRVWDCNHSVGLVTAMDADPGFAYLGVLRDAFGDPPFGARERTLLLLLLPAFRAGIRSYLRLESERELLGAILDASEKRILLCDRKGRILQRSAALDRTLAADPERTAIERAMGELAQVTASLARSNVPSRALQEAGERILRTGRGGYRVFASRAGEPAPGPAGILVLLEPLFRESLDDGEIKGRYGLTPQEIRVARGIAEGLANADVARRLGISPHTARRHTERVLDKLGIASRAQVAERISRI